MTLNARWYWRRHLTRQGREGARLTRQYDAEMAIAGRVRVEAGMSPCEYGDCPYNSEPGDDGRHHPTCVREHGSTACTCFPAHHREARGRHSGR